MMYRLGTNFCHLVTSQKVHWYQKQCSSILIDIPQHKHSCYRIGILERQHSAQLWVRKTHVYGTNFCELHSTQGSQRYHAWMRSNLAQPGSSNILMDIQTDLLTWHITIGCVSLSGNDAWIWNKLLWAAFHQGKWMIPCLDVLNLRTAVQQHPHWYSIAPL